MALFLLDDRILRVLSLTPCGLAQDQLGQLDQLVQLVQLRQACLERQGRIHGLREDFAPEARDTRQGASTCNSTAKS